VPVVASRHQSTRKNLRAAIDGLAVSEYFKPVMDIPGNRLVRPGQPKAQVSADQISSPMLLRAYDTPLEPLQASDRFAAALRQAGFERWESQAALETFRSSVPDAAQRLAKLTVSVQEYDIADGAVFGEGAE